MQVITNTKTNNNGQETIIAHLNGRKSSTSSGTIKRANKIVTFNFLSKLAFHTKLILIILIITAGHIAHSDDLIKVCDSKDIKTVTTKVCILYKRTKYSVLRVDKQGNLRIARDTKGESPAEKLAHKCCKVGCSRIRRLLLNVSFCRLPSSLSKVLNHQRRAYQTLRPQQSSQA